MAAGCVLVVDGRHSHLCRLDAAPQRIGMGLYPRSRVFYQQAANAYVALNAGFGSEALALSGCTRLPRLRSTVSTEMETSAIQLFFAGSTARLLAFPATGRHPEDFFTSRGWVPALFNCSG
jgi:hypothetical protein